VYNDESATDGIGYNFQTRKTKETRGLSVKSPEDMFPDVFTKENDIVEVFNYIDAYDEED
jgi:hypothetical protein